MKLKLLLCFAVVLSIQLASSFAVADSAMFKPGSVAPILEIRPSTPTTSDLISFSSPLDEVVYSNACEAASVLGGEPILTRDNENRSIELGYDGNAPVACPLIFDPTVGATGEFGPLPTGEWTFSDRNNSIRFVVVPEPSSLALLATAWLLSFGRLPPLFAGVGLRVGRRFELWCGRLVVVVVRVVKSRRGLC